jgi:hypothetical protein
MRIRELATVLIALAVAGQSAAQGDRLATLLRAVEEEARVTSGLRAEGTLTVTSPEETRSYPVLLVYRPSRSAGRGTDLYIELSNGGGKAIILDDGASAFRASVASKAEPFARDAALAGSDFVREDLQPFVATAFGDARISDENSTRMTVSLAPKDSQYSLQVVTIDVERKLLLKTLYYQETVSNLAKMRRDSDHLLVGSRWLPSTITMEHFKLRTRSTLQLKWRQDSSFAPELFDRGKW